ncbi:transposase [Methanothrix sp.]|uniref:transposase n=1 Tax=Methanothrix sp. TaxID=90426 RepID=UPI003C72CA0A
MYKNKTSHGGRPNIDIVIMIKLIVLQHWFGLSDPELERQVADRISFCIFLGTTEVVPDFSTVWLFRERVIKSGKLEDLWGGAPEADRQERVYRKGGLYLGCNVYNADPGQKRKKKDQEAECKKEDKDSETIGLIQVQEFDKGLLDISNNIINSQKKPMRSYYEPINEGSWTKKGVKSFFGYKGHIEGSVC